jgi:Pentapeptide repeats (9 copies)
LTTCQYKYDSEYAPVNYEGCREEARTGSKLCIFHDENYVKDHFEEYKNKATKRFEKKVHESISENKPLECIGYFLPAIEFAKYFPYTTLTENGFSQPVYFNKATFYGANFREVIFSAEANFYWAKFQQVADFYGSTFKEKADFGETTFSGVANFNGAKFYNKADFFKAAFSKEADFGDVVNFNGATFSNEANFSNATFEQGANFLPKFYGTNFKAERAREIDDFLTRNIEVLKDSSMASFQKIVSEFAKENYKVLDMY